MSLLNYVSSVGRFKSEKEKKSKSGGKNQNNCNMTIIKFLHSMCYLHFFISFIILFPEWMTSANSIW